MRRKGLWIGLSAIASMVMSVHAGTADISTGVVDGSVNLTTLNGNLSGWGVSTPGNFDDTGTSWASTQGGYSYEDSVDTAHSGYVGPGYGSQNFDAEALYTGFNTSTNTLYVALVTGFNIGGEQGLAAGDLFVDFGSLLPQNGRTPVNSVSWNNSVGYQDTGAYSHSWDLAFDIGTTATPTLAATTGFSTTPSPVGPGFSGGPLWATGGTSVGSANFLYTANFGSSRRNLYEFSYVITDTNWLNLLYEGDGSTPYGWTVHWTMQCGNDFLDAASYIDGTPPQDNVVPVPAAAPMGLLGMGLLALVRRVRRRTEC